MDANEIIMNEEVIDVTTEELKKACFGNKLTTVVGIAGMVVGIAGMIVTTVKAVKANRKAKKEQEEEESDNYVEVFDEENKAATEAETEDTEND